MNTSANSCIAYYWVTTYSDGSQTWQYLTTICTGGSGVSNPNYPNEEYPNGDVGGGDGDIPDPGISISRAVTYIIKDYQASIWHWKIEANFTISGIKYNDIIKNYFNGINHELTLCWDYEPAHSQPNMDGYFIFTELSHSSGLLSSTTTSANVSSSIYYPNLPSTYGGPKTDYYSLGKTWQASTDLF